MNPKEQYKQMVERLTPNSELPKSLLRAFWVGGVICILGQLLGDWGRIGMDMSEKDAAGFASIVMIFLGSLLTGFGVYDRIGQYAGGGSIIPITGFANAIVASAMEYRREGLVMGVGAKLFLIAGPVIVYGVGASIIVGLIAYFVGV